MTSVSHFPWLLAVHRRCQLLSPIIAFSLTDVELEFRVHGCPGCPWRGTWDSLSVSCKITIISRHKRSQSLSPKLFSPKPRNRKNIAHGDFWRLTSSKWLSSQKRETRVVYFRTDLNVQILWTLNLPKKNPSKIRGYLLPILVSAGGSVTGIPTEPFFALLLGGARGEDRRCDEDDRLHGQ
jgi:hypothetical protein